MCVIQEKRESLSLSLPSSVLLPPHFFISLLCGLSIPSFIFNRLLVLCLSSSPGKPRQKSLHSSERKREREGREERGRGEERKREGGREGEVEVESVNGSARKKGIY